MEQLSRPLSSQSNRRGFTLIELLVVLTIIALMGALIAGFTGSLFSASNLKTGGRMLSDYFGFAQQLAITKNRRVEFRLYFLPETAHPEISTYHAFQIFTLRDKTTASGDTDVTDSTEPGTVAVQETKVLYFPAGVHIFNDAAKSSLLSLATTPGPVPLPGVGLNYKYLSVHFTPLGSTDLNPVPPPWFITLVDDPSAKMVNFPANFYTVQINPTTGKISVFQP